MNLCVLYLATCQTDNLQLQVTAAKPGVVNFELDIKKEHTVRDISENFVRLPTYLRTNIYILFEIYLNTLFPIVSFYGPRVCCACDSANSAVISVSIGRIINFSIDDRRRTSPKKLMIIQNRLGIIHGGTLASMGMQ